MLVSHVVIIRLSFVVYFIVFFVLFSVSGFTLSFHTTWMFCTVELLKAHKHTQRKWRTSFLMMPIWAHVRLIWFCSNDFDKTMKCFSFRKVERRKKTKSIDTIFCWRVLQVSSDFFPWIWILCSSSKFHKIEATFFLFVIVRILFVHFHRFWFYMEAYSKNQSLNPSIFVPQMADDNDDERER